MAKFKLDQEVFVIKESIEKIKSKCLDCNGEGSIPSMVKDKKIICSSCKGKKIIYGKDKKKYEPITEIINCITIFNIYLDGIIIEEYTISSGPEIYSTNVGETINRMENMSYNCFDAGYNNVEFNTRFVKPIGELYESKDEVIKICKELKKSNRSI